MAFSKQVPTRKSLVKNRVLQVLSFTAFAVGAWSCNGTVNPINGGGGNSPTPTVAPTATPVATRPEIFSGGSFTTLNGQSAPYLTALTASGAADSTFTTTGTGFNGNVTWLTSMGANKVLASGRFTAYNGATTNYIERLNSDGMIDPSFASAGTGFNNVVYCTAIDQNEKIAVAGAFRTYDSVNAGHIARLNSDGSLDTTFVVPGAGFNYQSNTVAIDSANRMVVGGYFTNYNGTSTNYIARLNSDASLDTTFAVNSTGFNNDVQSILIDANGKLIVVGEFTTYNGIAVGSIVRLNADGTLDTSFNSGGAGFNASVWKMSIDASGKILVGGHFTTYNGVPAHYIARLNSDGSLDTSFATGTGFNSDVYAVQQDASGKILVGGPFTTYTNSGGAVSTPYLTRLNADGSLDPSFTNSGSGLNGAVYKLLLLNVAL